MTERASLWNARSLCFRFIRVTFRLALLLPVFAFFVFGGIAVQWLGERIVRLAYWMYDRSATIERIAKLEEGSHLAKAVRERE